jgi:hypothetical protein
LLVRRTGGAGGLSSSSDMVFQSAVLRFALDYAESESRRGKRDTLGPVHACCSFAELKCDRGYVMRPFQISDDDKYTSFSLCTLDMKKASRFSQLGRYRA